MNHKISQDTDGVVINGECMAHSGMFSRMRSAEKDIEGLWEAINQIRNWVVVGMATVIGWVGFQVVDKFIK